MVADSPKLCSALTLSPKSPMTAKIHVRPHRWVYFKSYYAELDESCQGCASQDFRNVNA